MSVAVLQSGLPRSPRSRVLVGVVLALLVQGAGLALLLLPGRQHGGELSARLVISLRLPERRPDELNTVRSPRSPARMTVPPPPYMPLPHVDLLTPASTPEPGSAPVTAAEPAVSPRPALNLALPVERPASSPRRETMMDQVRSDPRVRTPRRSFETVIADGAGTLPVTVNASTDGTASTIIRQGSKCTRVSEARIRTLNPMDENARATPSVAGSCFKD